MKSLPVRIAIWSFFTVAFLVALFMLLKWGGDGEMRNFFSQLDARAARFDTRDEFATKRIPAMFWAAFIGTGIVLVLLGVLISVKRKYQKLSKYPKK